MIRPEKHLDLVDRAWSTVSRNMPFPLRQRCEEDLKAAGALALVECARSFRSSRAGSRFRTWAAVRIRGAMLDHLRMTRRWMRDGVGVDIGGDRVAGLSEAELVLQMREGTEWACRLVARLDGLERVVMEQCILGGKSIALVASELKLSRKQVWKARRGGICRVRADHCIPPDV